MTTARESPARLTSSGIVRYLLVGVGSAAIGLLPWVVTGMRLPLQNLWAVATFQEDMPIVLLPFSQYALGLLPAVIVVGSAIAGLIARKMGARLPRRGLAAIVAGVVGFQAVAVAQTALTVAGGLGRSTLSDVYLGAGIAGSTLSVLLGFLVLMLVARATAPGAVIGLSITAVLSAAWLGGFGLPFGTFPIGLEGPVRWSSEWAPAVMVALALVWAGLGSTARIAAAAVSLLALWVVPAVIIAASVAVGSRVNIGRPAEMLATAERQFFLQLGPEGHSISMVLAAGILTVVGLAARWAIAHRAVRRDHFA